MEKGEFLAWLKRDRNFIKEGDPIFTLESDKAAQEVEAIDSGILRIPLDGPKPGDVIKVGHVLGYLLAEGESAPVSNQPEIKTSQLSEPPQAGENKLIHSPATILLPTKSRTETPASPRARRAAKEHRVDLATLAPPAKAAASAIAMSSPQPLPH